MEHQWYVLQVYSNFEKKVMAAFTLPDTTYAMLLSEYNHCMSQVNNAISNAADEDKPDPVGILDVTDISRPEIGWPSSVM